MLIEWSLVAYHHPDALISSSVNIGHKRCPFSNLLLSPHGSVFRTKSKDIRRARIRKGTNYCHMNGAGRHEEQLTLTCALSALRRTTPAWQGGLAKEGKAPHLAINHPKCRAKLKTPLLSNQPCQDKKISLISPFQVQTLICTTLRGQCELPSAVFHSRRVQILTCEHPTQTLAHESASLSKNSRPSHCTPLSSRVRRFVENHGLGKTNAATAFLSPTAFP